MSSVTAVSKYNHLSAYQSQPEKLNQETLAGLFQGAARPAERSGLLKEAFDLKGATFLLWFAIAYKIDILAEKILIQSEEPIDFEEMGLGGKTLLTVLWKKKYLKEYLPEALHINDRTDLELKFISRYASSLKPDRKQILELVRNLEAAVFSGDEPFLRNGSGVALKLERKGFLDLAVRVASFSRATKYSRDLVQRAWDKRASDERVSFQTILGHGGSLLDAVLRNPGLCGCLEREEKIIDVELEEYSEGTKFKDYVEEHHRHSLQVNKGRLEKRHHRGDSKLPPSALDLENKR